MYLSPGYVAHLQRTTMAAARQALGPDQEPREEVDSPLQQDRSSMSTHRAAPHGTTTQPRVERGTVSRFMQQSKQKKQTQEVTM